MIAALAAWLVPGAGHVYLGRRGRAAVFATVIFTFVALGLDLGGHLHTSFAELFKAVSSIVSAGLGLAYLVLRFLVGYQGDPAGIGFEYGGTFLVTAGLLNLLLVLDAWEIASGRKD